MLGHNDVASRVGDAGGWSIHERYAGSGPPLVLVHGLAVSSRYFVPLVSELADTFTCRALDLPGFGRSASPPRALDVRELADALAAWLRSTGQLDAPLLGNSAGCQFIVDCVTRHDDVTGPLVLIGPTVDPAAPTASAQIGRWLRTAVTNDVVQLPILVADCRDAGLRRVAATFRASLADRIERKLPNVGAPVLIVRGARDPLAPQRWAEEAAALAPRGEVAVVKGGAHVVHMTRPAAVAAVVRAFLGSRT